jgi:hypothetical protein
MRLFELLLVLSNISLLALTVLLKKGQRRIPIFVASGIATLFTGYSLGGGRIQGSVIVPLLHIDHFFSHFRLSLFQKNQPPKNPAIHIKVMGRWECNNVR